MLSELLPFVNEKPPFLTMSGCYVQKFLLQFCETWSQCLNNSKISFSSSLIVHTVIFHHDLLPFVDDENNFDESGL